MTAPVTVRVLRSTEPRSSSDAGDSGSVAASRTSGGAQQQVAHKRVQRRVGVLALDLALLPRMPLIAVGAQLSLQLLDVRLRHEQTKCRTLMCRSQKMRTCLRPILCQ